MANAPVKKPVMNNYLPEAFKHRDKKLEDIMNEMGTAKLSDPPRPKPFSEDVKNIVTSVKKLFNPKKK